MPMAEGSNEDGARSSGLGARLVAARTRADLSQFEAAELLHVDPGVIQALEAENFNALGAPVYVRGHLRHYAELVKESAPELLSLYAASVTTGPLPDLTRMPHAKQTGSWRGALVTTGAAVVIGVGLIGSVRWIYLDLHPATGIPVASAPVPAASSAAAPEFPDVPQDSAPAAAVVAPAASSTRAAAPGSAPHALGPPASRSATAAGAGLADASVTLKFRGACWTEVYDARGAQLFHAIGAAGSVETLHGLAPLKVLVGNVPEVNVEVDGQAQVIPVDAQTGRAAEFLVTHEGALQPVRHVATAGNNS
jgi:cytoskeleton protein RodZ